MQSKPSQAIRSAGWAVLATIALAGTASAAQISITVTNNSSTGGLFLTPLLSVFHDGSFDTFDLGSAASSSLESLAEDGNVTPEQTRAEGLGFTTSVSTGPEGFGSVAGQPPLLDAGETSTIIVDLDPSSDLYYTFLSMVLPTNDNFIGNADPLAYRLFDDFGEFTALDDIEVFGAEVWDAGTEENNLIGAPFTPTGGDSPTDTVGGVVAGIGDLDYILGQATPVGEISSVQGATDLLATISFSQVEVAPVPLPAALPMLLAGMGTLGALGMRRRNAAQA